MQIRTLPLSSTALAVIMVLGLGACSPNEEGSAGQRSGSAVGKVEQKTDQTVAAVKQDANAAGAKVGDMADKVGSKARDVAITTGVNAELARDPTLSAMKINVDTESGRVALRGTAPDAAAKERAATLAQKVDGVVRVDNQLDIRSN